MNDYELVCPKCRRAGRVRSVVTGRRVVVEHTCPGGAWKLRRVEDDPKAYRPTYSVVIFGWSEQDARDAGWVK